MNTADVVMEFPCVLSTNTLCPCVQNTNTLCPCVQTTNTHCPYAQATNTLSSVPVCILQTRCSLSLCADYNHAVQCACVQTTNTLFDVPVRRLQTRHVPVCSLGEPLGTVTADCTYIAEHANRC